MPPDRLTEPDVLNFIVLPLGVVALFVWGIAHAWKSSGSRDARVARAANRAAVLSTAWMIGTWIAAARGTLRDFTGAPPPFFFLVMVGLAITAIIGFGNVGRRLAIGIPLWVLVAVQCFRLPLEVAMHRMAQRGIMPEVMSYTGRNFDIVTGLTAIPVAVALATGFAGRRLAMAWNLLGLGLLVNVVTVAILATPRFQYFGPRQLNVWVTYTPFVWLPAVLVLAALLGHIVIFRACRVSPSSDRSQPNTARNRRRGAQRAIKSTK